MKSISKYFRLKIDFYDKITNDKMTKMSFEKPPQRAKTARRGSDRVALLVVG